MQERRALDSPALCFPHWNLKEDEQKEILCSDDWVAEEKFDGVRALLYYYPEEGFNMFSRNISVETFLPISYTDKILFIKDGVVKEPKDFIGEYDTNFTIDNEMLATKNIDTSILRPQKGSYTDTLLSAAVSILALNEEESKIIQKEQCPLEFRCFDILRIGDYDFLDVPYKDRKESLKGLVDTLKKDLPISYVPYVQGKENKEKYLKDILDSGREGVVYKHIDSSYPTTRDRHAMVKFKGSMTMSVGKDIDAFVVDVIQPNKGSGNDMEHILGGLKMAIYVDNEDGSDNKQWWIASVSSIPLDLRRDMSEWDGKSVKLNPNYLGKVFTIDGQDLTSVSFRFSHAVIRSMREDKSPYDCVMTKSSLIDIYNKTHPDDQRVGEAKFLYLLNSSNSNIEPVSNTNTVGNSN